MKLVHLALISICGLGFAAKAQADFGELDLIVRESVESYFSKKSLAVVMAKFSYSQEPESNGRELVVFSSVWAEQRQLFPYWGWYDCETRLSISQPQFFDSARTTCSFDPK